MSKQMAYRGQKGQKLVRRDQKGKIKISWEKNGKKEGNFSGKCRERAKNSAMRAKRGQKGQ